MASRLPALAEEAPERAHRTLAEKAFDALHQGITSGRLAPGTRLPIEELARTLRMSPMPIREALRRLDAAGLVENIPHRGARVTELSTTDLAEVYEARLALEVLAIRRAAERFDIETEATARQLLDTFNAMPDDSSAATSEAHAAFHFCLYKAAGSAWLLRLVRPLWETAERYVIAYPDSRRIRDRAGEHEAILAACADRDPDRAAADLHDHLVLTANHISAAMHGGTLFTLSR
jgi:DNA-binding GntR family transcriptional regulator